MFLFTILFFVKKIALIRFINYVHTYMSFKLNRSSTLQELNKLLFSGYPCLIKALAVIRNLAVLYSIATLQKWKDKFK